MVESEVIIVGGGPAGSTCAWKLRRQGIETMILDKEDFPRTKLCAGWITPKVIKDLEIDLNHYPHSLKTFNRLHFHFHGRRKFVVRTRQYSIRRYEFDHYLVQRAGVPLFRHKVKHVHREKDLYIIDETYRAKYLVGAGGTHCPVYQQFFRNVNPRAQEKRITTMEGEFPCKVRDSNCYLWFFERDMPGYSWYVPKGEGYLNLGIGGKFGELKAKGETIREHWDFFIAKLNDLNLLEHNKLQPRGYNYYLRQNVLVSRLDNAFITGDAAGLATRDMGEGIGPAVESGIRAADAIIYGKDYSLKSISRYSLFNILLPWRYNVPIPALKLLRILL